MHRKLNILDQLGSVVFLLHKCYARCETFISVLKSWSCSLYGP